LADHIFQQTQERMKERKEKKDKIIIKMDDDFLAEQVLFSLNLPNSSTTDISVDELIDSTTTTNVFSSDEITLNAKDEHIELTSKFFNNSQLSDICLRVGKHRYHAHKFILAKSSDVLATLLYSQHWTSTDDEVQLEEQEQCQNEVFERFLQFFYTAKITLHESNVIGLLYLSDKYNVQS